MYVYKTNIRIDFDLPFSEILIFTSPSNVIAYYNKYKVDSRQMVIAIGTTTRFKLNEYNVMDVLIPDSFDEKGLFDCVVSTISAK